MAFILRFHLEKKINGESYIRLGPNLVCYSRVAFGSGFFSNDPDTRACFKAGGVKKSVVSITFFGLIKKNIKNTFEIM